MGLKTVPVFVYLVYRNCDKIRPKWDWKIFFPVTFAPESSAIKSDQNGIENLSFYHQPSKHSHMQRDKIRPKWDWKPCWWNIKWQLWWLDKIRPKWDWKPANISSTPRLLCPDKIRPKWDWKTYYKYIRTYTNALIKSDQNGIEKYVSPFHYSLT